MFPGESKAQFAQRMEAKKARMMNAYKATAKGEYSIPRLNPPDRDRLNALRNMDILAGQAILRSQEISILEGLERDWQEALKNEEQWEHAHELLGLSKLGIMDRIAISLHYAPTKGNSMILEFGKYKGKDIQDVPGEYLEWLIATKESDLKIFKDEVERRALAEAGKLSIVEQIVKEGYRSLSKKAHPDQGGTGTAFQELQAAKAQLDMILKEVQNVTSAK